MKLSGQSTLAAALISTVMLVSNAHAQPNVSVQLTVAAGGGLLDTIEAGPMRFAVSAAAVAIDPPGRDPFEPVNKGQIAIGDDVQDSCEITSAISGELQGCIVTLVCEGEDEFEIVPGGAEVGSINGEPVTAGQIVTKCLMLPPVEPPARVSGYGLR